MKLLKVLLEQEKILVPRRSREERAKNYDRILYKKIQQYIKDGSKGDLDFTGSPITSLPDNLEYVGGDLNLFNSGIKSLPDNLKHIAGTLFLENTPITSLPDNLKVEKDLNLMHSAIKSLPDNLVVLRNLSIDYTSIKFLPNNLKVGANFWINPSPLARKYSDEEIRNLADIGRRIFR